MFLKEFFKDKRILITGNTGFKGAWLSLYLHHLGARLYGLSQKEHTSMSMFDSCGIDQITEQYFADINDRDGIRDVVNKVKPDIIFHLAAQALTLTAYRDPLQTFKTNAIGTANILDVLREYDRECIAVIVTSDKCYRNNEWVWGYRENDVLAGKDPYSASKSVAEIITNSYYLSFFKDNSLIKLSTCRAGNVMGGGDWNDHRIIPDCIKAWMKKETLVIRRPKSIRPWNYILDVLTGYLLTAYHLHHGKINGEAFNLGPQGGSEINVLQLVETLWEIWDDHSFEPYTISESSSDFFEHNCLKLNSDKARQVLNWVPYTGIFEGLKETARWYREYLNNPEGIFDYSMNCLDTYVKSLDHNEKTLV